MIIRIALVTMLKVVPSDVKLVRGAMVFPAGSRGEWVAVARLTANTDGIVPALNAGLKDNCPHAAALPVPDGLLTGTCSMSVGGTTWKRIWRKLS